MEASVDFSCDKLPKNVSREVENFLVQILNKGMNIEYFEKIIVLTLFSSTCRRSCWHGFWDFFDGRPYIFRSESVKVQWNRNFSKNFVSPQCVALDTWNGAATALPKPFRQASRKYCLITWRKISFFFVQKEIFFKKFPCKLFCNFFIGNLEKSSLKTKNKYKHSTVWIKLSTSKCSFGLGKGVFHNVFANSWTNVQKKSSSES